MVLRRISAPTGDKVTGRSIKLHSEELIIPFTLLMHNGDQMKEDKMEGANTKHGRYEKFI
jgi:hypothetical protein